MDPLHPCPSHNGSVSVCTSRPKAHAQTTVQISAPPAAVPSAHSGHAHRPALEDSGCLASWCSPSLAITRQSRGAGGHQTVGAEKTAGHSKHDNFAWSAPLTKGSWFALPEGSKSDLNLHLSRSRRQLKGDGYDSLEGRTTTVAGFIDWGPTGADDGLEEAKVTPNATVTSLAPSTTTVPVTSTTTRSPQRTYAVITTAHPKRHSTTQPSNSRVTAKPPKPFGDTPGRAKIWMATVSSFSFCFLIRVRYLISLCLITYLKFRCGETQRDIFRGQFKVIHEHGAEVFGSQTTMQCIKNTVWVLWKTEGGKYSRSCNWHTTARQFTAKKVVELSKGQERASS